MRWIMIIKTTIVVNFQFTKFSFIDFVLTDRKRLSGRRPKSTGGKSSSSRFSLSIMVFFPLLRKFEPHYCQRYGIFSVLVPTKKMYLESWRLCRSFTNLSEWRVMCQQLIGYIITLKKKKRYFFSCVVTAFLRARNPCITPQFIW